MEEKLVDVIRDGEIVTVSEVQARAEDLFILRERHAPPAAPAPLTGHSVLRTASQIPRMTPAQKLIPRWHSYQPEYTKNNVAKELIDNFHWEIGKARRERNMTRLQMANALNASEDVIKMLENGELPSDDFVLINKVQSFLHINLRRDGRSFDASARAQLSSATEAHSASSATSHTPPAAKPHYDANISLAELQRMKTREMSAREKPRWIKDKSTEERNNPLFGDDIQIIE
ncbi:MAG TPA: hypothetical protein VJK07_01195 [Candidatus Nanoarchaeia archaeon]|nr:hypothetical protein [Candidatus Nanoarchaeia archaeon]